MSYALTGSPSIKPSIIFSVPGREVLRITSDGRMIIGEGLSAEDATQQAAKLLIEQFNRLTEEMVQKRIKNMETNK
jgi:hypothetical protein